MAEEKKKASFLDKLKHKYRLTMYNDVTLEEVMTFRLSRMNVFTFFGIFTIIVMILVFIMLVFTPLRVFLPNYTDNDMQRKISINALKIDSLEHEIIVRDQYYVNLKNIFEGKELVDINLRTDSSGVVSKNIDFSKSKEDSVFRKKIEEEEQFNVTTNAKNTKGNLGNVHFFAPINKGMITSKFNLPEKHYGIDIVAAANEGVKAVLEGTVITADWTMATGYVIQVQHESDLVSFYKHNSILLKKVGDRVKAGDVIAIIGNSGELTTGPHLHFELWYKGIPIDPQAYIMF